MSDDETMKSFLQQSLRRGRTNLRWKLSGLDERSLRWPRTPTGFNLLGALKHMAQVEIVYFGDTFGRTWPNREEVVSDADIDLDPQADWCATESETTAYLLDFYTRVSDFADETIDSLSLDSPGRVPHWPTGRDETTWDRSWFTSSSTSPGMWARSTLSGKASTAPPDSPRQLRTCRRTSTTTRISNVCEPSPTVSEARRDGADRREGW
ncbi:mycothiol transferase [Brevibacterium sediminis]|uniref:mycothiol transferase n=1 Tax=Brevibacterium sediminis TaxID=1857024 RepID=UPI00287041DD|nr:DUF664 domain-containing protein [Brevibacterium sediminis]